MSIHLRSRRGAIGTQWFAVALRETLERALGPTRAAAGRRLARADAVRWIDVTPGAARGDVRDADGTIATARLEVRPVRPDDRRALLAVTARTPDLAARLAGGAYPRDVEDSLESQEVPLLPTRAADVSHDCTCHDWPGPCVHVHALACVLVEAVEDEPVLLLRLRGLTLEDLATPMPAADAAGAGRGSAEDPADTAHPSAADPGALPVRGPRFDPASADAGLLVAELGPEAAAVLAAFYGAQAPVPRDDGDHGVADRGVADREAADRGAETPIPRDAEGCEGEDDAQDG